MIGRARKKSELYITQKTKTGLMQFKAVLEAGLGIRLTHEDFAQTLVDNRDWLAWCIIESSRSRPESITRLMEAVRQAQQEEQAAFYKSASFLSQAQEGE